MLRGRAWSKPAISSVRPVRRRTSARRTSRGSTSPGLRCRRRRAGLRRGTFLDDECGVVLAEVLEDLGHVNGVAGCSVGLVGDERKGGRARQQFLEFEVQVTGGEAHQGVLVDLEVAADVARRRWSSASWSTSGRGIGRIVVWAPLEPLADSSTTLFSGRGVVFIGDTPFPSLLAAHMQSRQSRTQKVSSSWANS